MFNVNSAIGVGLSLLGVLGSSTTLSATKEDQKTRSGTTSSSKCSTCNTFQACSSDPSDATYLLQTGSQVVRPAKQDRKRRVTGTGTTAKPASLGAMGTSFVQTSFVHTPYMSQPHTTHFSGDDVPGSSKENATGTLEVLSATEPPSAVDMQERMLSAIVTLAQEYRTPYKYVVSYNATSGIASPSKILVDHPTGLTSPIAYAALFLLVLVVSASLYLDTLPPRQESFGDQGIPKVHQVLADSFKRRDSKGVARRNHKLPPNTQVGLLEYPDLHSCKASYGPYAGVGKGGSHWETLGYNVLARLPGLHLFGGTFLLLRVFPRLCRSFGLWLQVVLLVYGALKFAVTGMWTAQGLWKISKHERQGVLQDELPPASSADGDAAAGCVDSHADGESMTSKPQALTDVLHCVVIPCYKEALSTVSATLDTLSQQTVASQIVVVLAMEARDQEGARTARVLTEQFQTTGFAAVFHTLHKLGESEAPGKSSNENWAFRCVKRRLCDEEGWKLEQMVFTTCDADTYFHPQHFEYLSHLFLTSAEPHRSVWQGAVCALPNSHALPALSSVRYVMLSLGYLGQLANETSLSGNFPLGIYSMSAKLAHDVGYWDPTVVPEDWHMFFRVNLESSSGYVRCVPMYTAVGNTGVEGSTHWESLKGCYKQSVRWQWGGISMGYLLMQLFHSKCTLRRKLSLIVGHYEHHFLLPLVWLSAVSLYPLYSSECVHLQPSRSQTTDFSQTAPNVVLNPVCHEGISIGDLSITVWAFFMVSNWITVIVLDWWYRSIVKGRTHFERVPQGPPWRTPWRALAFLLFPATDLIFHVIPTWHAYLKMFLSTGFEYEVAAKGALPKEESLTSQEEPGEDIIQKIVQETQTARL